jgi:hypothetical protein
MKVYNRSFFSAIVISALMLLSIPTFVQSIVAGVPGKPYPNMPTIAPVAVRIEKHIDINESFKGPSIDTAKGYRLQEFCKDLYMITDKDAIN